MRRLIFVFIFIIICKNLTAPSLNVFYLLLPPEINYYEKLIKAIVAIESSGDTWALNVNEQACGPFQIRPIRINHYNRLTGSNYKTWNCFDYELSRKIFLYFCKGRSYEKIARAWCSGEAGTKKASEKYWKRVRVKLLK
jgi:hypothetical protein